MERINVFSDENLKELKRSIASGDHRCGSNGLWQSEYVWYALLARLEAAEAFMAGAKYQCVECRENGMRTYESDHLLGAWLKASGKGEIK